MNSLRNSVVVFLSFISVSFYGQDSLSLQLLKMMGDGRYFESKELYKDNLDDIPTEIRHFYKFRMAEFMGKKDSASIYLEKMLLDFPGLFGAEEINMNALLFDIYITQRDFLKGEYTYNRMKEFLKKNLYDIDETELTLWRNGIEERMNYLKKVTNQPPIIINRRNEKKTVMIEGDDRLLVEILLNGISQKAYFDTGVGHYYLLNRRLAERIGIKCDVSEMEKVVINNTEMLTKYINIDSLEIGNITIYNVPATIIEHDVISSIPDSLKNMPQIVNGVDSVYSTLFNSVMGLPLMKLLGKFQMDYEINEITFPNFKSNYSSKEPNLFFYNSDLYTGLTINKHDFTGVLDIGSDAFLDIDTAFYKKHHADIPIDNTILPSKSYFFIMAHQLFNNTPYKVPYKPVLKFNNTSFLVPKEGSIKIYSLCYMWPGRYLDGVIGYDFFKRIGKKVLLDLDNMRLDAIE